MKLALRKCTECGRLFSAAESAHQCQRCSDGELEVVQQIEQAVSTKGLRNVTAIAESIGVSPRTVKNVLTDMPLIASEVENDDLCLRCHVKPSKLGSDYCTACLMLLDGDLREATGNIAKDIETRDRKPESPLRNVSVGDALRDKQRRTGHYRFNSAPRNIKRGK